MVYYLAFMLSLVNLNETQFQIIYEVHLIFIHFTLINVFQYLGRLVKIISFTISEWSPLSAKKSLNLLIIISIPTWILAESGLHSDTRTTETQWRHKSKKSEILGRYGRQNMLQLYLKIWDWDLIFVRAVKAISSPGVRSPCILLETYKGSSYKWPIF